MFIYRKEKKSLIKIERKIKNMKKILNTILVLALLVLVPTFVVNAQSGTNSNDGSITINKAVEGHTYTIYQVLKLESYDTDKGAYTYTIGEDWEDFILSEDIRDVYVTATQNGVDDNGQPIYIVRWIDGADKAAFAKAAITYAKAVNADTDEKNNIANKGSKDADASKVVSFTGLNLGYYLVDSTVGVLCNLTTTKPEATVEEKNSVPTVEKEVKRENEGEDKFDEENTASIGDTLDFRTKINVTAGAENYVLYDKMDAGLTFKGFGEDDFAIYLIKKDTDDEVEVANTNYVSSLCTGNEATVCTFKVDFTDAFELTIEDGDTIIVKYSALLNENAFIKGDATDESNTNETYVKYGDGTESTHDKTETYTYKFDLVKTDAVDILLDGAKFRLYDAETGGNEIAVVFEDGVYRKATSTETGVEIVVTNGMVTIIGLGNGTYWLEETVAPNGYNKLTSRVEVTISDANLIAETLENQTATNPETGISRTGIKYVSGGIQVENHTGTELPSTGGIGTVLFITIGSIMVLGFGVLLVTKLRISKMSA